MKMLITVFCFSLILFACNSDEKKENASTTEVKDPKLSDPLYVKGNELLKNNDCATCHHATNKIQGPSYNDIANKYNADKDKMIPILADRIIKGSKGKWDEIPMTPHPNLSKEDAETLTKFIFTFKD